MAEEGAEGATPQTGGAAFAGMLGAAVNSARVDELVERQIALANLQIEDMEKDSAVRSRTLRLVEFSALMKVAFEIFAALVIAVAAAAAIVAIWSASHARGVVIEAFQVPPSLTEQGLSGQVVASRIQDKLADLQAKTDSIRAPGSYQNNWGNDIKVQIPDTGVSIGEFNRYLRALLGRETHITGDVWRGAEGISVVARAGTEPGAVFSGKETELDALLQKAAESVYEKTQPYRYAVYLGERGKTAQSLAVLQKLAVDAPPSEQAWAYLDWALTDFFYTSDWRKGRTLIDTARQRDPGNADVYNTMSALDGNLDREEGQLSEASTAVRLFEEGRADFNPEQAKTSALLLKVGVAELTGDFHAALDLSAQIAQRPDFSGSVVAGLVEPIYDEDSLHDARAAAAIALSTRAAVKASFDDSQYTAVHMQGAAASGDWQGVIRDHATLITAMTTAKPEDAAGLRIFMERPVAALYALALAHTGNVEGAEAAIAPTPSDCDSCIRARGDIAAIEKRWDRAAWWYARAAKQAPSIPFAYLDWGRMLLAKGDADGAVAKFAIAAAKGPHFADPLEMWGEALVAKNRSDLALAKFEEANKDTPNWGRLHLKWGEALWWSGHKDEAKKQLAIARSLDLTSSEKSELERVNHG
jgi:tetratricopeptide (TPR) repeat protein